MGKFAGALRNIYIKKEMQDMHFEFEKREFLFGNDEKEKWGWFLSEI